MTIRSACLLLGCLALTACASNPTAPQKPAPAPLNINGTSWMLPIDKNSECEVPPIIEFDGTTAFGDLGCNRFEATVTIKGNNVRFDNVAATARMCAPAYMKLEAVMKNMLEHTRQVEQTADSLIFKDAKGNVLATLKPEKAGACN